MMARKVIVKDGKAAAGETSKRRNAETPKLARGKRPQAAVRPKSEIRNPKSAPALKGLTMRRIAVTAIRPAPYNPRKDLRPGDAEYEKLKRSIATFGLVDPLVWNERSGNLVGGHQRLKVLVREFGAAEVDVAVVDLDDAGEKALNVALNRIHGDWEDRLLAELLAELNALPDFDVELSGFDLEEIEKLTRADVEASEADKAEAEPIGEEFGVLVTCKNEAEQKRVFERMQKLGYKCRVLTL